MILCRHNHVRHVYRIFVVNPIHFADVEVGRPKILLVVEFGNGAALIIAYF